MSLTEEILPDKCEGICGILPVIHSFFPLAHRANISPTWRSTERETQEFHYLKKSLLALKPAVSSQSTWMLREHHSPPLPRIKVFKGSLRPGPDVIRERGGWVCPIRLFIARQPCEPSNLREGSASLRGKLAEIRGKIHVCVLRTSVMYSGYNTRIEQPASNPPLANNLLFSC